RHGVGDPAGDAPGLQAGGANDGGRGSRGGDLVLLALPLGQHPVDDRPGVGLRELGAEDGGGGGLLPSVLYGDDPPHVLLVGVGLPADGEAGPHPAAVGSFGEDVDQGATVGDAAGAEHEHVLGNGALHAGDEFRTAQRVAVLETSHVAAALLALGDDD